MKKLLLVTCLLASPLGLNAKILSKKQDNNYYFNNISGESATINVYRKANDNVPLKAGETGRFHGSDVTITLKVGEKTFELGEFPKGRKDYVTITKNNDGVTEVYRLTDTKQYRACRDAKTCRTGQQIYPLGQVNHR